MLATLYRPRGLNLAEGQRHKTVPHFTRQLMAVLIHWFPERKFVFLGDGGYASHELALFCYSHHRHATLASRFHGDANLYAPPPKQKNRTGGPRTKGRKLPSPQQVVAHSELVTATVSWYGGGHRRVQLASGTGHWYKRGEGLVPIRWAFVHDIQGTHQDEYFYTTDTSLGPAQIVSWFTTGRPIETTFQEVRVHLGFETPRQYVANSVLRTVPALLGLFIIICLIFAQDARHHRLRLRRTQWYVKSEPTFLDAMATVQWLFWQKTIFEKASYGGAFQEFSAADSL